MPLDWISARILCTVRLRDFISRAGCAAVPGCRCSARASPGMHGSNLARAGEAKIGYAGSSYRQLFSLKACPALLAWHSGVARDAIRRGGDVSRSCGRPLA